MKKKNLIGLTADEIFADISIENFEYRHALTIAHTLYKSQPGARNTNRKIPKRLSVYLDENTERRLHKPVKSSYSVDGTTKYLFRNREGKQFETVLIPDGKRNTVCVSVQSGCRMGCPFCVTAGYGFHGNLSSGDILNQVLALPNGERATHIVFMGMGEPMDNLENVLKACEIMTAEWGMAISSRNITVSTVGVTQPVRIFLDKSACNLTLSLFSPFPEERIRYVPAEKKYPVTDIIQILKDFPLKKKRRLSVAYIMIKDKNDTDYHLKGLIKLLKGTGIRINLLPYHSSGTTTDVSADNERMIYFKHNLIISGIASSVRKSRGSDIYAACGLLATGLNQNFDK